MSQFRGAKCDQCRAEGKHPGHGMPAGPLRGWNRVTIDDGTAFDFCSIKCAVEWLKERKRQIAAREKTRRERELGGTTTRSSPRGKP